MTIKKQLFFVFIFIIAASFVVKRNYDIFQNNEYRFHKKTIDELKVSYDLILKDQTTTAKIFFQKFINQPNIIAILKNANSNDKKVRDKSRIELYNNLINHFNRIKVRGVKQIHFHLPNCESFLRFHQPQKYGNNLKGIRYSVEKTNSELIEISGLEEGTTFNGFRNIFPIISEGQHLGSVGISFSFQLIAHNIEEMLKNKVVFILKQHAQL